MQAGANCKGAEKDDDGHYTATVARGLLAAANAVPVWVGRLLGSYILRINDVRRCLILKCSSSNIRGKCMCFLLGR